MAHENRHQRQQQNGRLAELDLILDKQWSRTMSKEGGLTQSKSFKQEEEASSPGAAQAPAGLPSPASQLIDMSKLVVREVIGVGAIGKVHRGLYNGQEVAIKLLDCSKPGQAGDGISDWRRIGLMKELRTWRKLQHPNVVKLIGASPGVLDKHAHSNVCCLVSEYMSNGTLRDYLMSHSRLSFKMILQLAIDIAKGLEYLHSKKIVHRDVKTRNILLDSNLRAKIADFDSARIEADNLSDMSGEIGTIGYMAPEVFDGRAYDCKSDVFSFGICLLEIYCCDMAYGLLCLSLADITKGLVYRSLRPKIPKSCPADLAYVMKRCWKKNPMKRPTMSEVVKMLEKVKEGCIVSSHTSGSTTPSRSLSMSSLNSSRSSSPKPADPYADLLWIKALNLKENEIISKGRDVSINLYPWRPQLLWINNQRITRGILVTFILQILLIPQHLISFTVVRYPHKIAGNYEFDGVSCGHMNHRLQDQIFHIPSLDSTWIQEHVHLRGFFRYFKVFLLRNFLGIQATDYQEAA